MTFTFNRRCCAWTLAAICAFSGALHAEPPPTAQEEVTFLLGAISTSQCRFNRNGQWYDAKAAEEHLRFKYERLAVRDLIRDAEDFIAMAATRSSLTGRQYEMKCDGAPSMPTHQWLEAALAQYRAARRTGGTMP